MVDKKYLKIGVAAMAVTALIIGLSVGLTQKNKNQPSTASASSTFEDVVYSTYDDSCSTGKSGKSGPTSPTGKSGKSGPTSPSEGKSGKSNDKRRQLYPGTEEFVEASPTQRRKLRADLINGKCLLVVVVALIYYRRWCHIVVLFLSIAIYFSPTRYLTLIISSATFVSPPITLLYLDMNTQRKLLPAEGKSGKSGPTSPTSKSGKSGPTSPSCGKSGKSNGGSGKYYSCDYHILSELLYCFCLLFYYFIHLLTIYNSPLRPSYFSMSTYNTRWRLCTYFMCGNI